MKFNPNLNPYQTPQNNTGNTSPYAQPMNNNSYMQAASNSQMLLPENATEQGYYSSPYAQFNQPASLPNEYKKGGKVKKASRESLPDLAERIRRQGRNGDTVLAHINPIEARLLKSLGGAGTKNPKTGASEFFLKGVRNFFKNPGKTISKTFKNPKRTIADAISTAAVIAGAMTGNPYIAAAGGGARSAIRGDGENLLIGALKGAGYATALNTAGNLAGSGLTKLGLDSTGSALTNNLAPSMSWTTPFSVANKGAAAGRDAFSVLDKADRSSRGLGAAAGDSADILSQAEKEALTTAYRKRAAEEALLKSLEPEKSLLNKAGDYFAKPENLVAVGSLGLSAYGALKKEKKPREKSPEELADEKKRYAKAMRLTPEEYREQQAYREAISDMRSNSSRATTGQRLYRKQNTPEEYQRTGKWFSYYDNPSFNGSPVYKKGGKVRSLTERITRNQPDFIYEEITTSMPKTNARLKGKTGGQDDKIPAMLSDGEYVIDASTVSDLGDGNNAAGAKILDRMRHNIRKHKRGGKIGLPPKAKSLIDYLR